MRTLHIFGFVALLAMVIAAGCGDEKSANPKQEDTRLPLLSDSLVLTQSDWVGPSFIENGRLVFDLNGDSLFSKKIANDLLIKYMMPMSCDFSHWLLQVEADKWVPFAYFPTWRVCQQLGRGYDHLLSDAGLQIGDFIDSSGRMRLRSEFPFTRIDSIGLSPTYTILPLTRHPGYRPFPLHWVGDEFSGMAPDGLGYWSFDMTSGRLLKLMPDRRIGDWIVLRDWAIDFAAAETGVWYITERGGALFEHFYAYSPCGIDAAFVDSLIGMALTDTSIWLLGWTAESEKRAFEVRQSDVCAHTVSPIDSLDMPAKASDIAAANNRYYVLLEADSLLTLNADGDEVSREAIPLTGCTRIEVISDTIHVLATGPKPFRCNDRMVVKFRLR